jgi:hypothetical protein
VDFMGGRARRELEDLQERIAQLRRDVDRLEESVGVSSETDVETRSVDRAVRQFRESMAQEDLPHKRAELEAALARAAELEAALPAQERRRSVAKDSLPAPARAGPVGRPRRPRPGAALLLGVIVGIGVIAAAARFLVGEPNPAVSVELAPLLHQPVQQQGQTFFTRQVDFPYQAGQVILSGSPPPSGSFGVDDGMSLTVLRPDGTSQTWSRRFNEACQANAMLAPQDVTELFLPGVNRVDVELHDECGGDSGTSGPILLSVK